MLAKDDCMILHSYSKERNQNMHYFAVLTRREIIRQRKLHHILMTGRISKKKCI